MTKQIDSTKRIAAENPLLISSVVTLIMFRKYKSGAMYV